MRIVISEFISLNGITQAPGMPGEDTDGGFRHGGWSGQFFDEDVIGGAWNALAERSDALLEGRRTWQISGPAWSGSPVTPSAIWINRVQKYVVSSTLTEADTAAWTPTTIIRPADLVTQVSAMRERAGGDVTVLGSSAVIRALMAADLVDELQLILEPIVLGGGKSIFPYDTEARVFEFASATTASTGRRSAIMSAPADETSRLASGTPGCRSGPVRSPRTSILTSSARPSITSQPSAHRLG